MARLDNEETILEIKKDLKNILNRKGNDFILDMGDFLEINLELYEMFMENPLEMINIIKQIIEENFGKGFKLKFTNFSNIETISNLRVQHINKIFKVKGMIGKTNKTHALVDWSIYECVSCGTIIKIKNGGKPKGCSCGNTNTNKFKFMKNYYRDLQEIEIEEAQEDLDDRQPQKIRVRLLDELTDSEMTGKLQPGNTVEIIGIVEEIPINSKVEEEIYEYRLRALDINNLEDNSKDDNLSDEEIKQIQEIAFRDNALDILANSIAPEVVGLEEIKKTLVLQQFGGVKKTLKDGKKTRERIHLLVVGDAGLSKTQLAKNVFLRTPKSFYLSGEQTTSAGLTATVERDEMTGNWGLKAGAMCKANESTLVVDEIDKAGDGALKSLHTPLESGIIPISKAGINTKLIAECSLLALANPKGGRFDMNSNKTIVEQINMPSTLLSRFDVIHVVKDEFNEQKDNLIIDSICFGTDEIEKIPVDLYRKYILYAKKIKPKLTKEIVDELKVFYNKVKKKSLGADSKMNGMPITPRNIQGIIRMAEASAKIRLNETVELKDLKIAQDLFYDSLIKIGMDEDGTLDFARITGGKTISKKKKSQMLFENLKDLYIGTGKPVEDYKFKKLMLEKGMQENEYYETIYSLNKEGYIIKKDKSWIVTD